MCSCRASYYCYQYLDQQESECYQHHPNSTCLPPLLHASSILPIFIIGKSYSAIPLLSIILLRLRLEKSFHIIADCYKVLAFVQSMATRHSTSFTAWGSQQRCYQTFWYMCVGEIYEQICVVSTQNFWVHRLFNSTTLVHITKQFSKRVVPIQVSINN